VRVIRQGQGRLWPHEQRALSRYHGHVREVLLLIDGRPAVWARSVAPLGSVKGPWRAIKGLGSRPLAELLFERRHVLRTPLVGARLHRHSPQWGELRQAWPTPHGAGEDALPQWARHSVFERHGHPLQVLEAFAPWVSKLSAGRSPRHR
jgi:chorismate--pyruvate lyase